MQDKVLAYLVDFDDQVPSLTTLRNVAEHFDDYTTGKGRVTQIERHQLQVWDLAGIPTEVSYGVGWEPSSR